MFKPVGDDSKSARIRSQKHPQVGELEQTGHQFTVLSSDSKPIFGEIPKWILNDLQAGQKPSLTSAFKEKGFAGIFSFIYYAVKGARNWKLPKNREELIDDKTHARITSDQLGIDSSVEKKAPKNEESKLEKEFAALKPQGYHAFLDKVIERKDSIQKEKASEEKRERLKRLETLEQGIASKILELNPELTKKPFSNLNNYELFENQRNIDQEILRIEKIDVQKVGENIFSRGTLEGAQKNEINNLKMRKEQIQNEFNNRAENAKKVLSEKLKGKASEAFQTLNSLKEEILQLEDEIEITNYKMNEENTKLKNLEKRKNEIPDELKKKQEKLDQERKKYIDPVVNKFDKQLDQTTSNLEMLNTEKKRLETLEQKRAQIQKGEKKAEGWFGEPLNSKEKKEYELLKNGEMKNTTQRQDLEESIQKEKEVHNKELIELNEKYLGKIEREIQMLKTEQNEIADKIQMQKKSYDQANDSHQAVESKYVKATEKQLEVKKILNEEAQKVKVELSDYARAVGFSEGSKLVNWTPHSAILPKELSEAFTDGIKELPLPPIDPNTFFKYDLFSKRESNQIH